MAEIKDIHKPVIETLINTVAIALTGFGVKFILDSGAGWDCIAKGFVLILFGAGLEFLKYWGRKKQYW